MKHRVSRLPRRDPEPPPIAGARWIPLGNKRFAIVDADLFDELSQHWWHEDRGYAVAKIDGKLVRMHRLICRSSSLVDHINGDRCDNRRANLRRATHRQNAWNKRRATSKRAPFKGVYPKGTKWRAAIGGRHLGVFTTQEDAARAYDAAARAERGPFARLNFPSTGEHDAAALITPKAQYLRDAYNRRRAAGLCWLCETPAVAGKSKCERHLAADRARHLR